MSGILNLPGLRELDKKESETEYHVKAEPAAIARLCPHCGELHRIHRHDNRPIYVRDLPTHGKMMLIHLDVPRLKCLACGKTFTAVVPEVDEGFQMTERLVRRVYRNGHGYTFERLRAKVLFTDRLQKRVPIQEKVKVKKQRFEDLSMGRMTYLMMSGTLDDDYEVKTKTRMGNVGTDLPTLLALLDSDDF